MCTYIYTMHKDCMHRQYQNTFKCVSARGGVLGRGSVAVTLDHTIHLPDALPWEVPDPMCREKTKVATRPVSGRCRACMRRERELWALEKGESCVQRGHDALVIWKMELSKQELKLTMMAM
ncbi:hypothetical protein LX36DRAFT_651488 [Colletotrichum falcatum]|nr:hypothetical protein LX36DRAFT_651488 [Colletotrichum falcatum]